MRKADYNLLADTIKKELSAVSDYPPNLRDVVTATLHTVAYTFALNASVDKREFIKACGIN